MDLVSHHRMPVAGLPVLLTPDPLPEGEGTNGSRWCGFHVKEMNHG